MDTPLVKALPEMKKLENYGGNTYEANLQLALKRAKLLKDSLRVVSASAISDPFGLNMSGPSSDLRKYLPGSPDDGDIWHLGSSAGVDTRVFSRGLGSSQYAGNYGDLAFFIGFLKNDDPSKPINSVLDDLLSRGIKYTPNSRSLPGSDMFGSITVPYKAVRDENGNLTGAKPSIDNLNGYAEGISKLAKFKMANSMTPGFMTSRISIEISPNQDDFTARVAKYSKTQRDLSRTQGINIPVKTDGTEILKSDPDANNRLVTSKIIINHEFAASQGATFGGDDSISETLLHEYGHTVHRSLGTLWGVSRQLPNGTIENNIDPDYEKVFNVDISSYGSNNHMEHFAESFANYLQTGQATPEFKDYLKTKLKISQIDTSVIPDFIRQGNVLDAYVEGINNNPKMNGYKFVAESTDMGGFTPDEGNLRDIAVALADPTRPFPTLTFDIQGYFIDPQGRKIKQSSGGTVHRTFTWDRDGLRVYHGLLRLPDSAQGTGLGTAFVDSSFEQYKNSGVKKVSVWAALTNGPYQWALMDFQWDYTYSETRAKRDAAIRYANSHYQVLEKYQSNPQFYDQLSPGSVAMSMLQDVPAGTPALNSYEIERIIDNMRKNGWTITNDLLNQLKSIAQMNPDDVTPFMLANLGRGNKKMGGKSASTIGRAIMMMIGDWHGYKDM